MYHGNNTIVSYPDYRILYIPCKPNTDYTVQKLAGQRLRVGFTDELPQAGVTISNAKPTSTNGTNDTQVTSTSGENSKYLCVWYWYKTEDKQALLDSIQIEVGSTATSYSPYTSQTYTLHLGDEELAKIGSYQDKIYYDNGKWYKYGAIGKKLGTELTQDNLAPATQGIYLLNIGAIASPKCACYCNGLTYKGTVDESWNLKNGNYIGQLFGGYNNIYINKDYTNNQKAEALAWLRSFNFTLYYVLATASTTEITNTTLLQDLNYIKEHISSFPDTTNISSSGDLSIVISASAIKQLS